MKLIQSFSRQRLVFLGVFLAIVALSAFGTIPAASAGGATVNHQNYKFDECTPYESSGSGYWSESEFCVASRSVLQQVMTPSGNIYYSWKEKSSFSYWSRGENTVYGYEWDYGSTDEVDYKYSWHSRDGLPQVQSWSIVNDYVFTDNLSGVVTTCVFEVKYHYANGKVTKDTFLSECVTTP